MSGHVWRCPGTPTGCPPPRTSLGSTVDSGTLHSIHTIPRLSQKGHTGRGCAGGVGVPGVLCAALPCTQTAGAPTLQQAEAGLTAPGTGHVPRASRVPEKQLLKCLTKSKQQPRPCMRLRLKQVPCGSVTTPGPGSSRLSSTQYRHACRQVAPQPTSTHNSSWGLLHPEVYKQAHRPSAGPWTVPSSKTEIEGLRQVPRNCTSRSGVSRNHRWGAGFWHNDVHHLGGHISYQVCYFNLVSPLLSQSPDNADTKRQQLLGSLPAT